MAWLIESISIAGGFLGDLALELPKKPALICVIGPRGSGKSTLVEALRFAFAGLVNAPRQRQDMVAANLGQAVVTVTTAGDAQSYVINRRYRQEPSLASRDGRAIANIDLDRGSFLPLDVYGSLEIESIADESFGDKRRALVDELHRPEHRTLIHALSEKRRELEANADAIRLATQQVHDLAERIEELGDVKARIDSLPAGTAKSGDAKALATAHAQQQANASEAQFLKTTTTIVGELARVLPTVLDVKLPSPGGAATKNARIIQNAEQAIGDAIAAARTAVTDAGAKLGDAAAKLKTLDAELAKAHSDQQAAYRKLQGLHADAANVLSERAAAQQALTAITELQNTHRELSGELEQLRDARTKLRGDYLLQREQLSAARERIATGLEKEAGPRVRVRIERNADNAAYKDLLLTGLKGARVRNHDEILAVLLQLPPERLAEVIQTDAVDELTFGAERSKKILEALAANVDPFALETVEIEDQIAIELDVGSEGDPNFKDAAELSRGQKCTAMLPLLLARRDTPLLIDQPEDNLDNHFIYETVVEAIKRLKTRRQMIFVTHNANIPVLGEADLVVCMGSDGRRGYITRSGTIDQCRTEIIDLLEGGREAFDLRRKRYDTKR
ncbi:MAG: AAA family ATPase [Kofleriaceae bacterium]